MSDMQNQVSNPELRTRRRNWLLAGLGGVVIVSATAAAANWLFFASKFVATDDAYSAVEVAQVTSAVSGLISEVRVKDTQPAKQGEILVVVDPTDSRLALAQSEAEEKRIGAQLASAGADYKHAAIDLKRREALIGSGSVSADELTQAQHALATAEGGLSALKASMAQARARSEQARVDLARTVIRSPVDGVVARRQVQLGQRVQPGTPLLSVVPVQDMHVDANFKEGQLEKVRIGQAAAVKADIYGDSVVYHGVVEGISSGTGSAFAAIPAQNATGNWIKVVQRLPVRIRLDPADLSTHPLKVGLSMLVKIETSN